jgi:glycosyltransferase involved in cell wall biosynthesis
MPALWYENEPLVVKAALHLGIPIIASNIGSLSEMLDHGKKGTLVKPGDSAELAGALRSTIQAFEPGRYTLAPVKSMDLHAEEMFSVYRQETKTSP